MLKFLSLPVWYFLCCDRTGKILPTRHSKNWWEKWFNSKCLSGNEKTDADISAECFLLTCVLRNAVSMHLMHLIAVSLTVSSLQTSDVLQRMKVQDYCECLVSAQRLQVVGGGMVSPVEDSAKKQMDCIILVVLNSSCLKVHVCVSKCVWWNGRVRRSHSDNQILTHVKTRGHGVSVLLGFLFGWRLARESREGSSFRGWRENEQGGPEGSGGAQVAGEKDLALTLDSAEGLQEKWRDEANEITTHMLWIVSCLCIAYIYFAFCCFTLE